MAVKMTASKVLKLGEEYEAYYQNLHRIQKEDDTYYELTFSADVPDKLGFQEIIPPTSKEWVEVGIRNYTLDNPKSVVKSRGTAEADKKKDGAIEAFQNYWLEHIVRELKEGAKTLLKRGEVFFNPWMDDTHLGAKTEEEKKARLYHFPIGLNMPDPINVFASPAHNGLIPTHVIERYEITVAEAQNLCELNKWKWTTSKKPTDKVMWTSYYSATERCFLIERTAVLTPKVQPNVLGFCPYIHVGSGLGHKSYEGKPEYLYRSIIYDKKSMLKMQARLLSMIDALHARYAYPKAKITGEVIDVEKFYGAGPLDFFDPTTPIRENERVKVEILSGEQIPPSLFQQMAMIMGMAQPPEVLSGGRPTGIYHAQGLDTLAAHAKPLYKDPIKNYEDGLAVLMDMGTRIVGEVYKHSVAIGDIIVGDAKKVRQLEPSDIEGYRGCSVKLLADSPEATEMRKRLGDKEQIERIISHYRNLTVHHDLSKEEAEEEIGRIMAEQAINSPMAQEVMAQHAAQRLGMGQVSEQADAAGKKVSHHGPPVPDNPDKTAYDASRKRGRTSGGMEAQPTPGEEMSGRS